MHTHLASLRLGAVHLRVADLDAQADFYCRVLGLSVVYQKDERIAIGGDNQILIVLKGQKDARPALGTTGLFHAAFQLPARANADGLRLVDNSGNGIALLAAGHN